MSLSTMVMSKPQQMLHVGISSFLWISIVNVSLNLGNVAYEGEDIQIDVQVRNEEGKHDVKKINA